MHHTRFLVALVGAAALLPGTAQAQRLGRGEPPITAQTQISGGVRPADQAGLRLTHLDLAIEVFPESQRIEGLATLDLTTDRLIGRLLIDLDKNLPVSAISYGGQALDSSQWSNPDGRLVITLPRKLAAGDNARVTITYGGTPHVAVRAPWDDGIVWSQTASGEPWVGSTAEGYGCDLLYPCLDFPLGEPEAVDLHFTVPAGLKAPANGTLVGVDTHDDGRTTWNWHAKSPNPYSVMLNVAPYEEISGSYASRYGNSIPMYFWHLPGHEAGAKGVFDEFAPTLDFFESLIGPYPWGDEKLAIVETPYLGMEHQTINAYGNNFAKNHNGFDDLFQHELAHEWFGNQVTAASWDDYWIHEGYAQYMQPLYGLWREGDARYAVMMDEFRRSIMNQAPIVSGEERTEEAVYEAENGGPGGDIYVKGAWVLHTLRNTIGDDAFYEVTRRLVYGRADPRPGNFQPRFSSTRDYMDIVNQVTGKDYDWFFDVYLYQAALPRLVEERQGDTLTLRWAVPGDGPFPLPVEIEIDGETRLVPMTGGRATLDVPASARVLVDPHARVLRQSDQIDAYQAYAMRRRG
ncbi:M1 family metallopeptidase [Stakelama tenebrarum]|uniref:Aminopeptidase N n=1 Tax=Stakelama tenebrarum TaxID=2711215 RepID=A0A6G6Y7P3_9SPHN|nr:M1 family metallopeptidase [Sphingosinithalassobacter tenebrarum]QIG80962.1 M1 family metallopeptidase [Sphingosinithalassobacter tenebrarum]